MSDTKAQLLSFFSGKGINVSAKQTKIFDAFADNTWSKEAIECILKNENLLMEKWKIISRLNDIKEQRIIIPNATIAKAYKAKIDLQQLQLTDVEISHFDGLEGTGLLFNKEENTIEGIPCISGDLKFTLLFKLKDVEDEQLNEKTISLIVNPDPKSLWKNVASNKSDPFWKADDVALFEKLGDKHIVVASKRGRSHQNIGSFREDDFAFKNFEENGWSLVAVSDGAGSYSLSRKGSQIACSALIDFFADENGGEKFQPLEQKLSEIKDIDDEILLKETEVLAKQLLYKATVFVHNKIKADAEETAAKFPELFNNPKAKSYLDYYHATLIFTLFKRFHFGYVVLSFGVGDCPVALMNTDQTETTLLNWLDVGEFGGGTRFITQPEIFHSTERPMASRFNLKIVPDFSYLFLMSDGIYDPKFVVEANLEKNEKWHEFLEDLKGNNEEHIALNFGQKNETVARQLSDWMDFWSPGNHDDRTLAIVY